MQYFYLRQVLLPRKRFARTFECTGLEEAVHLMLLSPQDGGHSLAFCQYMDNGDGLSALVTSMTAAERGAWLTVRGEAVMRRSILVCSGYPASGRDAYQDTETIIRFRIHAWKTPGGWKLRLFSPYHDEWWERYAMEHPL